VLNIHNKISSLLIYDFTSVNFSVTLHQHSSKRQHLIRAKF